MRCKKHLSDFTSTAGVCASCLRQRLFALIAAQTLAQNDNNKQKQPVSFPDKSQSTSPHQNSDAIACMLKKTQLFDSPKKITTTTSKSSKGGKFSSMIMAFFRSKKQDHDHVHREFSINENGCRGMSPNRENCSSESLKQTPRRTPASVRRNGHSRNVSGFTICLSPLVRASPNVRCGGGGGGGGVGGQVEMEFCKNRSRKLAGFGRNNNY